MHESESSRGGVEVNQKKVDRNLMREKINLSKRGTTTDGVT